jgi:hypothetical protein
LNLPLELTPTDFALDTFASRVAADLQSLPESSTFNHRGHGKLPISNPTPQVFAQEPTSSPVTEPTIQPATEPTPEPALTQPPVESTPEPASETDPTPTVDTSGTNPAVLTRNLTINSEYLKLTTDNYALITNFQYTEPFANNRMSFRFKLPVLATDVLGEDLWGLGDLSGKWSWVATINRKTALVVATELFAPTASEKVLGTGNWVLAPSLIYAFFVNKNIIIAPAYIHNFSFAGDGDRANIHRGDFDLYMVYTSNNRAWWMTSDLGVSFNYETSKFPAFWKLQYGRTLAKLSGGGVLNGFIRPSIGVGGDRDFDWSVQVGLSLIGF